MNDREDVVLMIGETLLIVQKVERFLAMALLAMVSTANPDENLQKALRRDKETLGRLIRCFSERTELPEHSSDAFDQLLKDQNVFVHDLFMQSWFDLSSSDGCAKAHAFLRGIRASAKVVIKVLMGALKPQDADAARNEQDQRYIDHIVHRVSATALPDFGGLTEDEYIKKIDADVRNNFVVKRRNA